MGRIVVSEFVSLDGVVEDPAGDQGYRAGGWAGRIGDRTELDAVKLDEALDAGALLLGRRSYEFFAARWPSRGGDLAKRLNELPKYVVSSTLDDPAWAPTSVLTGDVGAEVAALRERVDGDVVVYASFRLVRTLMDNDLVDELRLTVCPVALGSGRRLFDDVERASSLRLTDVRTVGDGVVLLTYVPDRS